MNLLLEDNVCNATSIALEDQNRTGRTEFRCLLFLCKLHSTLHDSSPVPSSKTSIKLSQGTLHIGPYDKGDW